MSKIKFVLPIAAALGVAFVLSCSSVDEAVQQSQCASNQGEWDANAKMCVKCPDGTSMNAAGQCVASAPVNVIVNEDGTITIICPARTKLDESRTKCVADIVAVDPNAAKGKYYCDYGKLDPLAVDTHDDCFEIEYQSECSNEWSKLVASCQAKDRRTDIIYCDYGPVDEYGGGCYWVLSANDCDSEWGIVADKCGTHGKYPNGTVCPDGKTKVGTECRVAVNTNSRYCDYGEPYVENGEVLGDCWPIANQTDRDNCSQWGIGVNVCPAYNCPAGTSRKAAGAACEIKKDTVPNNPIGGKYCYYGAVTDCYPIGSSGANEATEAKCEGNYGKVVSSCSGVVVKYCNWGTPYIEGGNVQGGCWSIKNATEEQNCPSSRVVNSCPSHTCPAGTTKITNSWGDSGCELSSTPTPSTPSTKYCFYGKATECWPIISSDPDVTTEAECEEHYGKVVTSCSNVTWEYCDWGEPIIKENGTVDRGCYAIKNAKERSDCQQWGTISSSCPNYTCPAGTTKVADDGWGNSACKL